MSEPNRIEYRISCSGCDEVLGSQEHTETLAFLSYARAQDWDVPDVLANKPIRCPKCKIKP